MKKITSTILLCLLLCGFANAGLEQVNNICDIKIKVWNGTIFNQIVHFSSYSCAENAGATNIHPGGFVSQCIVFTCIEDVPNP